MRRAISLLLPLALAACASAGDYPSLARRPAEMGASGPAPGQSGAAGQKTGSAATVTPEAPPAPPPPLSAEFTTRLSQLVDQARAAHRRFTERRPGAERLVASGGSGAPGSEGWSVATVALSDLESARSDAMIALAELDQMFASESIAAADSGDAGKAAAVGAARDEVTALVGEEDAALAQLRGRMRD